MRLRLSLLQFNTILRKMYKYKNVHYNCNSGAPSYAAYSDIDCAGRCDVATRSYAGYGDIVAVAVTTATATATRKKSGYGYGRLRLRGKNLATPKVSYGNSKKIWSCQSHGYGYVAIPARH